MTTMVGSIISASITGLLALIGVIYTNSMGNKKIEQQLVTAQEITKVELRQLKDAIEKHNKPAEKVPILEERINTLDDRVSKLENRVDAIDRKA